MTIIFFEQKYAALTLATKIFKNQEYHLFLPKGMQYIALVGKTNGQRRGLLGMYAEDWTKCGKSARRTSTENWTGGGRQVPQYNWGLMDKEARIPEYIRDNKHRSACKNAYEMHNCQSSFSGKGTTFLENESTFLGKQVTLSGKQILINSTLSYTEIGLLIK